MKINVAPKGKNVGYVGKKDEWKLEDDKETYAAWNYVQVASKMEDSTERAFAKLEALKADTISKIEI